jgi:hypothetical protein
MAAQNPQAMATRGRLPRDPVNVSSRRPGLMATRGRLRKAATATGLNASITLARSMQRNVSKRVQVTAPTAAIFGRTIGRALFLIATVSVQPFIVRAYAARVWRFLMALLASPFEVEEQVMNAFSMELAAATNATALEVAALSSAREFELPQKPREALSFEIDVIEDASNVKDII